MIEPEAVRLEGVARRFGRRWALRGVSLGVQAGEAVVLLGRNGSGKTTLLRVLSTALRPTRGGGTVFGQDLVGAADAVRALVGYLGHAPGLYPDLSAQENLEFALRMRAAVQNGPGRMRVRVEEALEEVGLLEHGHERVRGFSAGMKRRLSLARTLLAQPRLLLLDEPYASFDAAGIEFVHRAVRSARARGAAILIATHDPERSAAVADRWTRMQQGRVVEIARPSGEAGELAATRGGAA